MPTHWIGLGAASLLLVAITVYLYLKYGGKPRRVGAASSDDSMAPVVQQLRWQLQELAQPADVQIALEGRGYADELALDFDDWYGAALDNYGFDWTERQRSLLSQIDCLFDAMSGPENAELWTDEALQTRPDWENVRHLAKEALNAFGWSLERPPRHPRAAR